MTIIEYESCTLCGQKVVLKSFTLNTKNGLLYFCCAGCQSIYQLLNGCESTHN
ncbi:MAG: TRASH domain-containing protein [Methylococcales bacterium]|nr:MAG: TRASH domain-containing protein [Methylococcales bacterium]